MNPFEQLKPHMHPNCQQWIRLEAINALKLQLRIVYDMLREGRDSVYDDYELTGEPKRPEIAALKAILSSEDGMMDLILSYSPADDAKKVYEHIASRSHYNVPHAARQVRRFRESLCCDNSADTQGDDA
jgi:hypothetical protein